MTENGAPSTWMDTTAGKNLQKRLTDTKTLNSLDSLLSKIDSLEKAVSNLTMMMQQGPGMVAMVADMADETYKKASEKGVSIEERLSGALAIAEKLTAPAMVEKLDGLLKVADQAPGLIAMTMDMVDEGYRNSDKQGISIESRLSGALAIAEKLTAPAMVEKLDGLLKVADQAPGLVAMTMDMVDEGYRASNAKGINIEERLSSALAIAEKLTAPAMVEKLDGLLKVADQAPGLIAMTMDMVDEGMKEAVDNGFDIAAVGEMASIFGGAMSEAKAEPPVKVGGIFGIMRVLKDENRQKGLGFLMNFLKHLGRKL